MSDILNWEECKDEGVTYQDAGEDTGLQTGITGAMPCFCCEFLKHRGFMGSSATCRSSSVKVGIIRNKTGSWTACNRPRWGGDTANGSDKRNGKPRWQELITVDNTSLQHLRDISFDH